MHGSPSSRAISISAAAAPCSPGLMSIAVTGGEAPRASWLSIPVATISSSGTPTPRSAAARSTPAGWRSSLARIASGGSAPSSSAQVIA